MWLMSLLVSLWVHNFSHPEWSAGKQTGRTSSPTEVRCPSRGKHLGDWLNALLFFSPNKMTFLLRRTTDKTTRCFQTLVGSKHFLKNERNQLDFKENSWQHLLPGNAKGSEARHPSTGCTRFNKHLWPNAHSRNHDFYIVQTMSGSSSQLKKTIFSKYLM